MTSHVYSVGSRKSVFAAGKTLDSFHTVPDMCPQNGPPCARGRAERVFDASELTLPRIAHHLHRKGSKRRLLVQNAKNVFVALSSSFLLSYYSAKVRFAKFSISRLLCVKISSIFALVIITDLRSDFLAQSWDFRKTGYEPKCSDVIQPKSKINFR